jgi:hypothetical protein
MVQGARMARPAAVVPFGGLAGAERLRRFSGASLPPVKGIGSRAITRPKSAEGRDPVAAIQSSTDISAWSNPTGKLDTVR